MPPMKSSEPDVANLVPNTCEVTTPSEMRVWNSGDALNCDMDWNPRPTKPSGGKMSPIRLEGYWVAAPRVCDFAYVARQRHVIKRKVVFRTVRLTMLTASVNCSPLTMNPFTKAIENVFFRSCAVELALVSYVLCPEQLDPHFDEGKKISLLPVSKSTVSC